MKGEKWHFRGREACGRGAARELRDARLSPAHRAAWFAGYDEEARMRVKPTPEQREESHRVVGNLKAWALENLRP